MRVSKAKMYRDKNGSVLGPKVQHVMDIFQYAYERYLPTLERLQKLSNAHDNVIDSALFPTISKMGIPSLFSMVEEALPSALDFVWPDSHKTYSLMPLDTELDLEQVERIEWALNYMVRQRMNAKMATLPIIRNGIKLNLGYGAVVPYVITPPATLNRRFVRGGETVSSVRTVGVGKPRKALKVEHVGAGEIIPMDDGSDFNGTESVSWAFRIKLYQEDAFRRLFKSVKMDTEDIDVKGNAEDIIAQAKSFGFFHSVDLATLVAELGGYDLGQRAGAVDNVPALIPVIQCYGEHEQLWIANGTTIIWEIKDSAQTLHRPLLKASCTVDMKKWHAMGTAEAGQYIASGKNLYANLLMDFIIRAVKPPMMYDKGRFGNKPPVVGFNGEIGVDGNVEGALSYPSTPQLNTGHLAYDGLLDRQYGHAVGQSMTDPSPGMLRGGLHAFESLLNTTAGRQRLANMVLEMGFVQPLGVATLTYMQLMAAEQGMRFADREYDSDTGKERLKYVDISHDDIAYALDVSVDTRDKGRGISDFNERFQTYNALAASEYVDQYENIQQLVGDYNRGKRLVFSRERVREMQEEARQRQAQEQQAAAAQQPGAAAQQPGAAQNAPGGTAESIMSGAMMGGQ